MSQCKSLFVLAIFILSFVTTIWADCCNHVPDGEAIIVTEKTNFSKWTGGGPIQFLWGPEETEARVIELVAHKKDRDRMGFCCVYKGYKIYRLYRKLNSWDQDARKLIKSKK